MFSWQDKKVKMFFAANGKCEYCGVDMLLSINELRGAMPLNLATIDHKYNRDHPLRNVPTQERRLFIVCWKCNDEKSRIEPNRQESNTIDKSVARFIPKKEWTNDQTMERFKKAMENEAAFAREASDIDKEIIRLTERKTHLRIKISKSSKYRNLLLTQLK